MSMDLTARALAQKALRAVGETQGADAYEVAVAAGFVGTRTAWLASLKGEQGIGTPGKDAYQLAVDAGFVGSRTAWLSSLQGADGVGIAGKDAYQLAVDAGFAGDRAAWLSSLRGPPGQDVDPIALDALQESLATALDRLAVLESPDTLVPLVLEPSSAREDAQPGELIGHLTGLHPFELVTPIDDAGGRLAYVDGAVYVGEASLEGHGDSTQELVLQRRLAKPGRQAIELEETLSVAVVEVAAPVPVNTVLPSLQPDPYVVGSGAPIADDGTWSGSPASFARRFYIGPTDQGPWSEVDLPLNNDAGGQFLQVGVIASNPAGPSEEAFSNVVSIEAAGPVVHKWQNTVFRSTVNGNSGWQPNGMIADPNDDENETIRVILGQPIYPTLIPGSANLNHGRSGTGASGTSTDATPIIAGGDELLGGAAGWTSNSGLAYTRDCGPGAYDFRVALGQAAGSGRTEAIIVFDGLYDNLSSSIGTTSVTNLGFWDPAMTVTTQMKIVSTIDLGIWECTTAGAAATTQPSGPGPTFNDGSVVWTRKAREALLAIRAATLASSDVIDQNGVRVAASDWRAQPPVQITISGTWGSGFCLLKPNNIVPYVRTVGIRSSGDPLLDLTLSTDTGMAITGSPLVYARQPEDLRALRINAFSGDQTPSDFTLSGALASYFKLTSYGSRTYLTHNGVPIPDSAAGAQSLTITQSSNGEVHSNTFDCTVVSSGGKPTTGWLSKITTQNWLNRKKVKDAVATDLWQGHQGQPFATDVLATSGNDFIAKLQAIPEGDAWHRIRLGNALYDYYTSALIANKAMGPNGGILIEPDVGVTAAQARFNVFFRCNITGLEIRGIHLVCDRSGGYQVRMDDPGPTGVNGSGYFNKLKTHDNLIGPLHLPGTTEAIDSSRGGFPFSMLHGQSFESTGNDFWGTGDPFGMTGVRAQRFGGNSYRAIKADIWTGSNAASWHSTQGVFADNHCYVDCDADVSWDEIDFAGRPKGAHADRWQVRAIDQNIENWWANGGKNGQDTVERPQDKWKVGDEMLSTDSTPSGYYRVTAVGSTGMTGSIPPSGAGGGIVDGDVTWEFLRPYTTASNMYFSIENCFDHSACPISDGPARQWLIDSNSGNGGVAPRFGSHDCGLYMSVNNNVAASMSSYGIPAESIGTIHAEFNTWPMPASIPSSRTDTPMASVTSKRGEVRTRNNYVRKASQGVWVSSQGDRIVNWKNTAEAPNRPSDLFQGPMVVNAQGIYGYPAFDETIYADREAFVTAWRSFVQAKNPDAGYQHE